MTKTKQKPKTKKCKPVHGSCDLPSGHKGAHQTKEVKKKTEPKKKFNHAEHWVGMPEFVQNDIAAARKLTVNFADEDAVRRFFKLINQSYTSKTRSIWFPEIQIDKLQDKRYASKKK